MIERTGVTRKGRPKYRVRWVFFFWPGHFFEVGWDGWSTRDNPLGRRLERWLARRAS